jgi:hypothetical protein
MRRLTPEDEAIALAALSLAHQVRMSTIPAGQRLFYHVTPQRNLASIMAEGLLLRYAQGMVPAIWLCTSSLTAWAIRHVQRRHGVKDVALLQVRVSRRLIAHFGYGRWFCQVDIPAEQVQVWTEPLGPRL